MFDPLAQLDFESWLDVLLMPAIVSFFGVLVFALAARKVWVGENGKWRWAGVALLLLAAYIGFGPFWKIVAPGIDGDLYRGSITGRGMKMAIAHYIGFILPVLCVLGAFAFEWALRNRADQDY
jgi:hypothetical protein